MASVNAIETVMLSKAYKGRFVCRDIHMIVRRGEIFGFLGPNGAGKSTFVKMLMGLVTPTRGSARLVGRSFRDPEARRQVGYLPELFRYPGWLTAVEVLDFHADLLKISRAPNVALLKRVGLETAANSRVKTFSKGMQQRLGLAVALVGDPELLILDEPTSAMDPLGRHQITEMLKELRGAGKTVFLNSHLLNDLEGLCDRVALIHHGALHYIGDLDTILSARPEWSIATGPIAGAAHARIAAHPGLDLDAGGLRYRGERADLPAALRWVLEQGVDVFEVKPIRSSLESWFVHRLNPETALDGEAAPAEGDR